MLSSSGCCLTEHHIKFPHSQFPGIGDGSLSANQLGDQSMLSLQFISFMHCTLSDDWLPHVTLFTWTCARVMASKCGSNHRRISDNLSILDRLCFFVWILFWA
jgi:hypothetical protein